MTRKVEESPEFWKGVFLVLQEMTLALHQGKSPEEILETVGEAFQELLGVEGGAVLWREGKGNQARLVFVGPEEWILQENRIRFPDTLFSMDGDIVFLPGGEGRSLLPWLSPVPRWGFAIPVRSSKGTPLAVPYGFSREPIPFKDAHHLILQAFRAHVATALENHLLRSTLEHLATTDPLTGLPNRRVFESRLQEELERLKRGYLPRLGVMLVDLDGLKEVNDRLGHPVGDEYLKTFARALRRVLRNTDGACRIGGDEFGLLLPGADREAMEKIVKRLRRHWKLSLPPHVRSLARFSAGAMVVETGEVRPGQEIIEQSDHALLQAKREGGDRLVFAESSENGR